VLQFRPEHGGSPLATSVQTTQRNIADVYAWAAGLSVTHIENAFTAAASPSHPANAGYSALPTPPAAYDRVEQLRQIENDVLSMFASRGATRMRTQEVFDHGPHANADFVRAFEELEKRWRFLVRHTTDGVDWLDLTPAGARAAGVPAERGTTLPGEPAKPLA
jgi:hypothetical protein